VDDRFEELEALEDAIRAQLDRSYDSYRDAGAAFKTIRDQHLYKERGFDSFSEYVAVVHEMSVKTAYEEIRASEVADDLPTTIRLPQRHAQLLWRFDRKRRREIAKEIRTMSARDATGHVLRRWQELTGQRKPRRRKQEPGSELRKFMRAIRELPGCDAALVEEELAGLSKRDRERAAREIKAAHAIISKLT
jgi:hypothetical protein